MKISGQKPGRWSQRIEWLVDQVSALTGRALALMWVVEGAREGWKS